MSFITVRVSVITKRCSARPGNPRLRAGVTAAARIAADAASTRSKERAAEVPPFIHQAHLSGQASSVRTRWIPHPSRFPDAGTDGKPAAPGSAAPSMELLLQRPTLSFPLHRKRLHQHRHRHLHRLPPIQDGLHDLRRQQGQPEHPVDVGGIDLLPDGNQGLNGRSKLRDGAMVFRVNSGTIRGRRRSQDTGIEIPRNIFKSGYYLLYINRLHVCLIRRIVRVML